MSHRSRLALVAAAIGLLAPAAIASSPASALDQDLVVSAAAGPPGTEITISSASCASTDDLDSVLEAQLISGTAPDEKLAGVGTGFDGSTTIEVPDWVDPAQPAVIEATCSTYDNNTGDTDDIIYDPVAFDVEPGAGPATQVRTFSRTSLLAGQAFTVTGSGCSSVLPDAIALVIVRPGTDLSGRGVSDDDGAGYGFGQIDASGDFDALVAVGNPSAWVSVGTSSNGPTEVEVGEDPNTVTPGTYSVFTLCTSQDRTVVLEPATIEVTGVAPMDAIDLTVEKGTRNVALAGSSCTQGDVDTTLEAESNDDLVGGSPDFGSGTTGAELRRAARLVPSLAAKGKDGVDRRTVLDGTSGRSTKAIGQQGTETTVTPDADGAWTTSDSTGFDQGIVWGYASCGDPLADGFFYNPQIVQIDVPAPVETTTTTTTTAPPPAPANAVPGTPSYAG